MLPNVSVKPNISTSNSIIGSRAYTFLDSYVYMKNQRYNALYEKNKEILAIENNAISIKSANTLYDAFIEEARILDSIIIRIRNFALIIKPDVIENIHILTPDTETMASFDNVISSKEDIPRMKYIKYDIKPIVYENMASFMNLYRLEINNFTSIKTQSANKENPFIKDKAAKYLIDIAMAHANSATELLEMESIKIMNLSKLKSISEFFKHKNKFISTVTRDFRTFQFYLRQYSGLRDITSLMKPTELRNGDVLVNSSSKAISFNDYFVLYKHFISMIRYMINIISYHEQQFFNKIYALQSNIENYVSIVNDVIECEKNKENLDKDENKTVTENTDICYDSYSEVCRISDSLGLSSPSIVENDVYSADTTHRPITKQDLTSLGYSDFEDNCGISCKRFVPSGYFYIDAYRPGDNWHMIRLSFKKTVNEAYDDGLLNSDEIDAHQMINGNDAAHMLLYDENAEEKNNDSIDELLMILDKKDPKHSSSYYMKERPSKYSDSIQDVDDETISNFEEYDGVPREGDSICTLRDSLRF